MTTPLNKWALLLSLGMLSSTRAETVIEINPAIPAAKLAQKASATHIELKEVRKKIVHVQKNLKTKQAQQQRTKQIINNTDAALQKVRQEIAELNRQQRISWERLQGLQNHLSSLQVEVGNTKAQISRLLLNNYENHQQPSAIMLFMKNSDVSQKSRLLEYSRYINQANDQVLKQLGEQQQQLTKQENAIQAELARLKKLASQQQAKLHQLGDKRAAALVENRQLAADIARQNQQMGSLRSNEHNLNSILTQINLRRSAAQAALRKQSVQQRTAKTNHATQPLIKEITPATNFSRLQGRMNRPIAGTISGRFGQTRASGGTWRGIFIQTPPASVQNIAAGEVAYAGDLRGYGNTIIIDHGNGYMSIYTGLSNIAVNTGAKVNARQSLGNSGTLPSGEQGLYFELRYHNRAMNPLAWVR